MVIPEMHGELSPDDAASRISMIERKSAIKLACEIARYDLRNHPREETKIADICRCRRRRLSSAVTSIVLCEPLIRLLGVTGILGPSGLYCSR
jgi:hypothetical protein